MESLFDKTLLRKISGYLHAKQMKRAKKAIKHLKTVVGRVVRDVERKIGSSKNLAEIFTLMLDQAKRLLAQERKDKNKALHGFYFTSKKVSIKLKEARKCK